MWMALIISQKRTTYGRHSLSPVFFKHPNKKDCSDGGGGGWGWSGGGGASVPAQGVLATAHPQILHQRERGGVGTEWPQKK